MPTEPAGHAPDLPLIDAADLRPGTCIVYADVLTTILSGPEPSQDIFGRPMMAFQARREDTGQTGRMLFGPGGVARLAPAQP